MPSNLEALDIGLSTVQINWIDPNNTQWIIEYGEKGFAIGEGITLPSSETSFTLENLESGTFYDIYLKSACEIGGFSNYIQPLTIITSSDFCAGDHFYDTGGEFGNYSPNELYTKTIYPNNDTERLRVVFNSFEVETGFDYLEIYDGETSNNQLIGRFDTGNPPGEIIATNSTGALTFVFLSDEIVNLSGWDAEVFCEIRPCTSPTNIIATNITFNSALIEWSPSSPVSENIIEYGVTGFELGTGTQINTSDISLNLTGLLSNTSYTVYIKGSCTDDTFSDYSEAYIFTTDADFCNGDHFYDTGGEFGNYSPNELYTKTIYPNNDTERLRVVFNSFEVETGFDYLEIYNGETSNNQLIGRFDSGNPPGEIIATNNTGALTFIFLSDNIVNLSGWDAEVFCEIKPCTPPTNIIATNITLNSALIEWSPSSPVSENIIEYGVTGFELGTGTQINTSDISLNLTGLFSNTSYTVYIKGSCTDGTFSDYSEAYIFTTDADFCNGDHFYDTGGEFGNYSNNENYIKTIYPNTSLEVIKVLFATIETESSFDYLYVYDGETTDANLLGTYSGSYTNIEHVSTHSSGALTFLFTSDSSVTRLGWDAIVTCEAIQNCTIASDLIVSDITSNLAYLSWSEGERSLNWFVEYGASGFTQNISAGIDLVVTNSTSLLLENLEPNFTYDIYITTECDYGGLTSDTYGPITFTTENIVLSTTENEYLKNNITLYPQPNNGTFTINNDTDANITSVTVYDVSGKLIQENTFGIRYIEELYTINNAASGVYFLRVETDKGEAIFKTIVE